MPAAIGMRAYCIRLLRRGDGKLSPIDSDEFLQRVSSFFQNFLLSHTSSTLHEEEERMWHIEEKQRGNRGDSQGYIHYGTFGFESDIVDRKTRKRNYRRKSSDVEQIPLFYDLWFPDNASFGLMAFQSFSGRSCKELVYRRMRDDFELKCPGYSLSFRKLMPVADSSSPFGDPPVKRLIFKRFNESSDDAENYLSRVDTWDLELSIKAQRRGSLGKLSEIIKSIGTPESGLITFEGVSYEEALAEVKIGKKVRRIGLTDSEGDLGLIDLTEQIEFEQNGHPAFHSIAEEVREILRGLERFLREEKL